jgi:hypothetical protein
MANLKSGVPFRFSLPERIGYFKIQGSYIVEYPQLLNFY